METAELRGESSFVISDQSSSPIVFSCRILKPLYGRIPQDLRRTEHCSAKMG